MINNNDNWKIYLNIIFEKIIFYFQRNMVKFKDGCICSIMDKIFKIKSYLIVIIFIKFQKI